MMMKIEQQNNGSPYQNMSDSNSKPKHASLSSHRRNISTYNSNRVGGVSTTTSQRTNNSTTSSANVSHFDLITLLEVSHQLTTRQKQLLIAIQQSDAQYLIDMDIMETENLPNFDFRFSSFNITPVMLACAIGSENLVKIMTQSPLRDTINHKDSQGFNCLYYAAYHGHVEIVKLLKKIGIEYTKDDKGTSCLHIAIMRGHLNIVEFLLWETPRSQLKALTNMLEEAQNGARKGLQKDIDRIQNQIKMTNQQMLWEQYIDVDEQRNDNGISTVFFAIRAGNLSCLKLLRNKGANFNLECMSESKQLMRPIQYAVYRGNTAIFELIAEYNKDQGENQYQVAMSSTGSSLMHLCAFKGNVNILKHLLAANLNPFGQNKQGDTCLHVAIRRNHINFIYELISWCVSKNITAAQAEVENQVEGLTPFMTAVMRDQFEVANQLVKNNLATRGYVNREGRDIRMIAEDANRVRALAYLDNREIPQLIKHHRGNGSMEQLVVRKQEVTPVKLTVSNLDARKSSVDNIPQAPSTRKDDIFGKSYDREMQNNTNSSRPSIQEEKKGMKAVVSMKQIQKPSNLPPFNKSRDFDQQQSASNIGSNPYGNSSQDNKDMRGNEARLSQSSQKSHASVTSLKSPLRRVPAGTNGNRPLMPKLDISQAAVENDDVEKINVKDFIKNSIRR